MLEFYSRVAKQLHGFKRVFWLIASAGLVSFIGLIFLPEVAAGPTYAFLSATITLWSLFSIVVVNSFSLDLPVVEPDFGFFTKIKIRLRRAALHVAAMLLTVTGVIILSFTFRAIASLISISGN